jgi:hypothetical protein
MAEQKIIVEIDENGKINAETFGIKGEVCIYELQKILDEEENIVSVSKTDEFFQKITQKVTSKIQQGRA